MSPRRALGVVGAVGAGLALVWTARTAGSTETIPVARPIVVTTAFVVDSDRVGRRETLSHLFARHGIEGPELVRVVGAGRPFGLDPRRVRPSMRFTFRTVIGEDRPDLVRTRLNDDGYLELVRSGDAWTARIDSIRWDVHVERVEGTITSSLNEAIHAAIPDARLSYGERDRLIWNTAENVYGWVIDFTRDPRPGDRFEILYERLTSSDGDVRFGHILAARIEIGHEIRSAYLLPSPEGQNLYYDDTGRSLHRAFLMYPVRFRRISSVFSRRRFHPILKRYRAHLGYDFAADAGTPIRATGDGTVLAAGRNGGLGIRVAIRHPKGIETRYGHMSRIARGIRPGVHVVQGQVIGYVGMTGLATAPHVHYEFLKHGRHINYRNADLGDGEPVPDGQRDAFHLTVARLDRLLDGTRPAVTAARADGQ